MPEQKADSKKQNLYITQREYYRAAYYSDQQEPWEGFFDESWLKAILEKMTKPKGSLALDVGAGKGRGSRILTKSGYKCVAIDYLLEPLIIAQMAKSQRKTSFVNADLMAAPFKQGSFALALDWGVFHHIRRRETGMYIRSVKRLLAPGGSFLLGCFSTKFRHDGETRPAKRKFRLHLGHYDRFSTRRELACTFGPWFNITSIEERKEGYYLLDMKNKGRMK